MTTYDDIIYAVEAAKLVHEAQQLDLHKAWADRDEALSDLDEAVAQRILAWDQYAELDAEFEAYRAARP